METFLSSVPLVGWGPILAIAAVAVAFLVIAVLLWRNHTVWRWVFVALFVVTGLTAVADWVNTRTAYYDTLADLFGVATYPTPAGTASGPAVQPQPTATPSASSVTPPPTPTATTSTTSTPAVQPQPDGVVTTISIPDTNSHFGQFEANVWLPPQYFTDTRAHFPVILLLHGNPGGNRDWLNGSFAAQTGLASAQAGKPVILVFPTVLRPGATSDSLCLDTASQGNADTYLLKDVVPTIDNTFRTNVDAQQRGIGGLSMGGYCALNLGLKHPDVFQISLDFSGETYPVADTLPGGLQQLFGANYQQQADANDPSKYWSQLDGSKGPALFLYCGTGDTAILSAMTKLAPELKSKGFTVELQSGPGAHEFATFGNGFKAALPWAASRFYP
ncbi:MAG TPA: alpha/beta hydrolase-fold protein [Lapillicoccus sp.]|nr:alpha/beta hydrolase-fold protein [Lapillicoccus sp.]